jgi:hypothetical protein
MDPRKKFEPDYYRAMDKLVNLLVFDSYTDYCILHNENLDITKVTF